MKSKKSSPFNTIQLGESVIITHGPHKGKVGTFVRRPTTDEFRTMPSSSNPAFVLVDGTEILVQNVQRETPLPRKPRRIGPAHRAIVRTATVEVQCPVCEEIVPLRNGALSVTLMEYPLRELFTCSCGAVVWLPKFVEQHRRDYHREYKRNRRQDPNYRD